jgi:D-alanyl-D-alanine carboxypeptidase/D-alanyl-D-alanine-endopeptidase (penicillin-binding protein 4)
VTGIGTAVLDGQPDPRVEFVFAATPSPRWMLSPQLPARGRVFLPVKTEPALLAAELFTTLATRAGIPLPAARAGALPTGAREIARVESAPLAAVIEKMLDYSNNLTAELLGLATSHALTGQGLTLAASIPTPAPGSRRCAPSPARCTTPTVWSGCSAPPTARSAAS